MAKITKRRKAVSEKIDRSRLYPAEEAFGLLKELSTVRFSESVDVSVNLGVDPRKSDQVVRGSTVLPNGTGKQVRVAVFTQGPNADAAKEAGADIVGMDELAADVKAGNMDFDVVIASPDMMGQAGKLGRILGPRGLMPNPKTGTVTREVEQAVKEAKAGRIEYRADSKSGNNAHLPIGRLSFEESALIENAKAVTEAIMRARPASTKGQYVRKLTLSTAMGPGVRIDRSELASA